MTVNPDNNDFPPNAETDIENQDQPQTDRPPALEGSQQVAADTGQQQHLQQEQSDYADYLAGDEENASGFEALGLSEPVLQAIAEMGYNTPTPIQEQAIPVVLMGRDVLGCAQTGTGKTASFTLPMLDILAEGRARARMPRSLILEPTRELALQVADNFLKYGKHLKLSHALLIGGESMNDQKDVLAKGVDVLIATPGRLIDLFERGGLLLTDTRLLVIDEADRMLDMGFIPDIERIVAMLPQNRQTLFFSATMAPEIRKLADAFLHNPKEITVSRPASVATTITSRFALVPPFEKREALRWLVRTQSVQNALVFCNRKRDVDVLYKSLIRHGFSAGGLHGDMPQSARFATLEKFKAGEIKLLVCSDVAARGIDISGLSHVFNFDVPIHAEDYVHRIGRTGRAGQEGHAITLASPFDKLPFEAVEKLIGRPIERMMIEGIDPVEWADASDRRQHGRRPQPPRRAERPEKQERSERQDRPDRGDRPERNIAEAPRYSRGERQDQRPDRQGRDHIDHGDRNDRNDRSERYQRDRGDRRPDPASVAQPNTTGRWERPRHQEGHDHRRRPDDLGPAPLGFGDDIPAFMTLPMRRNHSQPSEPASPSETETV